jgi:hypothetical protein
VSLKYPENGPFSGEILKIDRFSVKCLKISGGSFSDDQVRLNITPEIDHSLLTGGRMAHNNKDEERQRQGAHRIATELNRSIEKGTEKRTETIGTRIVRIQCGKRQRW